MNKLGTRLLCLVFSVGLLLTFITEADPEGSKQASKPSPRAIELRKAIAGADRVEVKLFSEESPDNGKPFSISGAEKIAVLAGSLDFDETLGTFPCACGGDARITFYNGDKVLEELTHAEGTNLRWSKWSGGGAAWFTPAAALSWPKWFNDNGFSSFEIMRLEKAGAADRYRKKAAVFLNEIPLSARKSFGVLEKSYEKVAGSSKGFDSERGNESINKAAEAFLSDCGKPFDAGFALCRALGTLDNEDKNVMRVIDMNEQLAQLAFSRIETSYLAAIFEAAAVDKQASFGAERLFFRYGLHRKLTHVSCENLASVFLKVVIERDYAEDALAAIDTLNEIPSLPANDVLRDVALGRIKPSSPEKRVNQEPGLRYVAVLSLARRGSVDAKNLVEALTMKATNPSDQAALAIARCFMGEAGTIRPEYFELESFTLGSAGVAALEKQGDNEALDLIITGITLHPWALVRQEAVHAVQRMTRRIWYHAQPNENEDWYGKEIREWWKEAKAGWKPLAGAGD